MEDTPSLKFVGGPRHGQSLPKPPATKSWPPKVVGCVSDIKPGDKMGLYRLRGATLEWFLLKPVQIKR
jgi:hypothetical protein